MIKAVVKDGVFVPRDPLPEDWGEGTEVEVEKPWGEARSEDELDRWYAELEAMAAQGDPDDDRLLDEAIREVRRVQKEIARKEMGLPE